MREPRHSGAMREASEPGISRFRVWCSAPSRNDGDSMPHFPLPQSAIACQIWSFSAVAGGLGIVTAGRRFAAFDQPQHPDSPSV